MSAETQSVPSGRAALLRELLGLSWPVVLARVGIQTMGLTDAVVVGRWSAQELGYHALGWAPTSIMITSGVGLLIGVQVMAARHVGAGDRALAGGVLRRGLVYAFWLGVASTLALMLLGPAFLRLTGIEPDLAAGASAALRVFALSLTLYLVSVAATFFLEALSKPKPGMWAIWIANAINLALNLWLVPGSSPFPVEGAVASAWATFFARASLAIFLLIYIARMAEARDLGVFRKPADGREAAKEQRKVGYAAGASYFIEVGAFAGLTLIAGQLGGLEAAAWAVVLNIAAIVFMGPLGLSSATGVLVGRAYGARDPQGARRAAVTGLAVTGALTLVISAVVWPLAGPITAAYATDPRLFALAMPALVLACLFFIVDGLQVVAAQALRAAADIWWPTAMHLISYTVVMLPLGWALAHLTPLRVDGLVWAVIAASVISAALLCGRLVMVTRRAL
jgi:MATE family multidrug resistance protein